MNGPATPVPAPDLHPLLARLVRETGAAVLTPETFDAWARQPGPAMVVFAEDPDRYKETLDLAVIVPELHATGGRHFRNRTAPAERYPPAAGCGGTDVAQRSRTATVAKPRSARSRRR